MDDTAVRNALTSLLGRDITTELIRLMKEDQRLSAEIRLARFAVYTSTCKAALAQDVEAVRSAVQKGHMLEASRCIAVLRDTHLAGDVQIATAGNEGPEGNRAQIDVDEEAAIQAGRREEVMGVCSLLETEVLSLADQHMGSILHWRPHRVQEGEDIALYVTLPGDNTSKGAPTNSEAGWRVMSPQEEQELTSKVRAALQDVWSIYATYEVSDSRLEVLSSTVLDVLLRPLAGSDTPALALSFETRDHLEARLRLTHSLVPGDGEGIPI